MLGFPARFFVEFFDRHGFLSVDERPRVAGRPRRLARVRARAARRHATRPAARDTRSSRSAGCRTRCACARPRRRGSASTTCSSPATPTRRWRLLADRRAPSSARCSARSPTRRTRWSCTPTQRLLPRRPPGAGRAGTTTCSPTRSEPVAVTYDMNGLQSLDAPVRFLRDAEPTARRSTTAQGARARSRYDHPVYSPQRACAAQARHRRDQRRAAHLFLRRLLALRLPRGRRGERARPALAPFRRGSGDRAAAPLRTGGLGTGASRRCRTPSATGSSCCTSTSPSCREVLRRPLAVVGAAAGARPLRTAPTTSATRRDAARRGGARPRRRAAPGAAPAGPIRLLTHLRYFGYGFNPVSFYYCFDAADRDSRPSSPRSTTRRGASGTATCSPRRATGHGGQAALPLRQGLPRLARSCRWT